MLLDVDGKWLDRSLPKKKAPVKYPKSPTPICYIPTAAQTCNLSLCSSDCITKLWYTVNVVSLQTQQTRRTTKHVLRYLEAYRVKTQGKKEKGTEMKSVDATTIYRPSLTFPSAG